MAHQSVLIHPVTLEQNRIYLRIFGSDCKRKWLPVTFIEYSACPAMVIIFDGTRRSRCQRCEIYQLEQP